MATHTLKINPASFALIAKGEKTLEVRLKKDGVENFIPGDNLSVVNRETGETLSRRIIAIRDYPTLAKLVASEDIRKSGGPTDADAFIERMRGFQTEADELEYGLVAIYFYG